MGSYSSAFRPVSAGGAAKLGRVEEQSNKDAVRYKKIKVGALVFAVIYLAVAIAYLFFISPAFIWTQTFVPPSAIPTYDGAWPYFRSGRWGGMSILFYLQIIMFTVPGITNLLVLVNPLSTATFIVHFALTAILAALWGVGMLIFYVVQWATCQDWVTCRNQDPMGNPHRANVFWYFQFFFHILFLVGWIFCLFLPLEVRKLARRIATRD